MNIDSILAISGLSLALLMFTATVWLLRRSGGSEHTARGQSFPPTAGGVVRSPDQAIPYTEIKKYRLPSDGHFVGYITGDILNVQDVDIWVNPENTAMQMARPEDFSISGLIRYWGAKRSGEGNKIESDIIAQELAKAVEGSTPVAPCSAFVTSSGGLGERNGVNSIVHVAAVHGEPGAGFRQVQSVALCVTNVLTIATRLADSDPHITSVLFPLLGTGTGGAGVDVTVNLLVGAVMNFFERTPQSRVETVFFLAYSEGDRAALAKALNALDQVVD